MRRAHLTDLDLQSRKLQILVARNPDIGRDKPRMPVNPGSDRNARCRQPLRRRVRIQVFAGTFLRNDLRARVDETLQPVNVIRMVMRQDDVGDRLVGPLTDLLDQPARDGGRTQCVDHDHACWSDHETSVRNKVLISRGACLRQPLNEVRLRRDLDGRERRLCRHSLPGKRQCEQCQRANAPQQDHGLI